MKYDDASWHYGGDFPPDSPHELGGTHIALYLKWCFSKGWAGALHLVHEPEDTKRVITGELSATDFLFKYCDEKLTDESLNSEGNEITAQYYGEDGLYLDDYAEHFSDLMYVVPESGHDYHKFASVLDSRLASGVLTHSQNAKKKPWWRVW